MQVTLCRMLVPVLPKELSVFPQPATNPVWPVKGRIILKRTRPSVNYAKDWLDQLFLFPGLVWSTEKGFQLWM